MEWNGMKVALYTMACSSRLATTSAAVSFSDRWTGNEFSWVPTLPSRRIRVECGSQRTPACQDCYTKKTALVACHMSSLNLD
jgi:hypothetical protein